MQIFVKGYGDSGTKVITLSEGKDEINTTLWELSELLRIRYMKDHRVDLPLSHRRLCLGHKNYSILPFSLTLENTGWVKGGFFTIYFNAFAPCFSSPE